MAVDHHHSVWSLTQPIGRSKRSPSSVVMPFCMCLTPLFVQQRCVSWV